VGCGGVGLARRGARPLEERGGEGRAHQSFFYDLILFLLALALRSSLNQIL
jgi:hypothetical protein